MVDDHVAGWRLDHEVCGAVKLKRANLKRQRPLSTDLGARPAIPDVGHELAVDRHEICRPERRADSMRYEQVVRDHFFVISG